MENSQKNNISLPGFDIDKLILIGQGHEGRAYILPDNKVLKVFYTEEACKSQLQILQHGKDSRFFPTVLGFDNYFIIMNFISGSTLSKYLRLNKLNKPLSIELLKLIEEFKTLHFTRLDIRLKHIFVQANETIKIIDPRGSFEIVQPYLLLMLKGLERYGALTDFFNNIKSDYPDYYNYWSSMIS
jgi:RIO-like serine/threonine protein kinase